MGDIYNFTRKYLGGSDFYFKLVRLLSLALGLLRLQPKIPSQVVHFIEKSAAACARQPKGSFGF
jgi:hypothetical protein